MSAQAGEVLASARWVLTGRVPLLTWLHEPAGAGAGAVLVAPPIGYEHSSSHRTLRVLAEALAEQGWRVARLDYDGTGDSGGDQWDHGRVAAWQASLAVAADDLRRAAGGPLTVIGAQLGATLAAVAPGRPPERLVLWDPVVDGRAWSRGVRLLGQEAPAPPASDRAGAVVRAGTVFRAETLADLRSIDLRRLGRAPAGEVLLVGPDTPAAGAAAAGLRRLGAAVEHRPMTGGDAALDRPAEYATVPTGIVDAIAGWVGRPAPARPGAAAPPGTGGHAGAVSVAEGVIEEVVEIGPRRLRGVATRPAGAGPQATVVWLNAGSEPHTGPGRAWVEVSRALAPAGWAGLRVDFSGWGESPDLGRAPGRPYDLHGVEEALQVVAALRAGGHRRVALAGVCAGAWIALAAAAAAATGDAGRPDGVVAINPQLYWQPGDPVEADLAAETHVRRADEIERYEWGRATGLWSALDRLGAHHPAAGWLDRLRRDGPPTLAVFARGDDGLQFLEDRVGGAWAAARAGGPGAAVELAVLDTLDHAMHRQWARPELVGVVDGWLRRRVGRR